MKYIPPLHETEVNLQAEFWLACRQSGIPCVLGYRTKNGKEKVCIIDAVVHNNADVIAIIEIKQERDEPLDNIYMHFVRWLRSRQFKGYANFEVPIFYIHSKEQFPKTIKNLTALIKVANESLPPTPPRKEEDKI